MKNRVTKDFETRSQSNLKKEGAYKYSLDPTTQPTCLAFKTQDSPTYFLDFYAVNRPWAEQPEKLKQLWYGYIENDFEFSAHNSFFERCIYDNILVGRYGWPRIKPRRRRCTAAKAAACALPRNLEGAGEAMKLRIQKDKRGYVAMMATCKPTRQYNAWLKARQEIADGKKVGPKKLKLASEPAPPMFLDPLPLNQIKAILERGARDPEFHRASTWDTLYTYCKIDARAEEQLDESLPDLSPSEQEIWHLNQMLNWRGLNVDVATIKKIVDIMAVDSKKKLKELDSLTMGLVTKPGARKSILDFLALEGIELPDLKSKTVDDHLKGDDLSDDMHRLLEIRKALTMTSTKKYQTFLDRVLPDGRVRDILLYHGASTGRDTGTGIQPHNFPRGLIKIDKRRPYAAVQNVIQCDADTLKMIYGDALAILFSALLRNMIIPSEGHELFVADYSKIEVAVLWWLADNKPGLKILAEGLDPYKYMASANTGLSYDEIPDDGEDRQLGKAQVLGCGFGMGATKFQSAAWDMYRLKLSVDQAKAAVGSYRSANASVPKLWKSYENAAIEAIETHTKVKAGYCEFDFKIDKRRNTQFLWLTLPSGRRLAYADPQITWRETDYGPRKTLEFMAVNSKTKKWMLERTWGGTLTENIVQATARDLMMPAMVRLEKAGYKALLMVHDEGICEKVKGTGSIDEFVGILCARPAWAPSLPLEAKGWSGPRYRK